MSPFRFHAHIAIKAIAVIASVGTSFFLYQLFDDRVKFNEAQAFRMESQLNLGTLAREIERRKAIISVLEHYFRSSHSVEDNQFQRFLSGLPNTSELEAVCWRSTDQALQYSVGKTQLCRYFSFAEQDKIIFSESLLMVSQYTQTFSSQSESESGSGSRQQGFITIFVSLQELLTSLPKRQKYVDSLVIFNTSSQQFVRINRGENVATQSVSDAVDLSQTQPIASIGDVNCFI